MKTSRQLRWCLMAAIAALTPAACGAERRVEPRADAGGLGAELDAGRAPSRGDESGDAASGSKDASGASRARLSELQNLIVVYLENHSFDNLYGSYPGVEGLASSRAKILQVDADAGGVPYASLPQADPQLPSTLPNEPFDITRYVPQNQTTIDLVHRFYQEQLQIDGDKMDQFVSISDALGLSVGFYPTATLPLAQKLQSLTGLVTVCDHFFHAAFGGSFLNHIWLVAAATPRFANAPRSLVAQLDATGTLERDGEVTPDGFVVNTVYSVNAPHPAGTAPESLLPSQSMPTIGDRLSDIGVNWAWYAGGWNDALRGHPDALFQAHHQPFVYFASFADGRPEKAAHLKDEQDFLADV
ncbi:MAG: acid phosphatase, partial [Myxococcaceae bacterium]|nr:acid phosphatase [Myxococcaceae bacterium]